MYSKGRYSYANGDLYEGELKRGLKNGYGVICWGANSKFAGNRY
jgi:hypothetical protein